MRRDVIPRGILFWLRDVSPIETSWSLEREDLDVREFMEKSFGPRVGDVFETEEALDERLAEEAIWKEQRASMEAVDPSNRGRRFNNRASGSGDYRALRLNR